VRGDGKIWQMIEGIYINKNGSYFFYRCPGERHSERNVLAGNSARKRVYKIIVF